jgi:hypothetical protein
LSICIIDPASPLRVHRVHAEHAETEMADRRVRHELLEVGLDHRDQRPVPDADDRKPHDPWRELQRGLREQRDREPHEAVGAHLEQHRREDHRAGSRGLDVRVRQPGVEREHRHLDRERERERQEQPHLVRGMDRHRVERVERETRDPGHLPLVEVEPQDRRQHEHAADHGVEEELDRRVHTPLSAPHADQQVHRDQHRLPEHVEQQQVGGEEGPEHAGLEREQEREELLGTLVDRGERADDRDHGQHHGQQHQQDGDPVDGEPVLGAPHRQPVTAFDELPATVPEIHLPPQRRCERALGEREHGRDRAREPPGQQRNDRRTDQWQENDRAQPGELGHRLTVSGSEG